MSCDIADAEVSGKIPDHTASSLPLNEQEGQGSTDKGRENLVHCDGNIGKEQGNTVHCDENILEYQNVDGRNGEHKSKWIKEINDDDGQNIIWSLPQTDAEESYHNDEQIDESNITNTETQSNLKHDLQDGNTLQGLSHGEEESLLGLESNVAPDKDQDDIPAPPDGGWGWVVCMGAFLCMVILDGMMFSFGVFFLDLLDYYGESKGKTAMVGSMLMGMHLFLGPVTSALVNLWGIRAVTMAGGVVAGAAFTISVFAPNIEFLYFSYGMMGGFGVSMIYIPSILAVGFYFEKRRCLANGITMAGSGIGTFVYAPMCNYLQDKYSWKGALLILSGIVLHCIIFGSLYRPLRVRRKVRVQTSQALEPVNQCDRNVAEQKSFNHSGNLPSIVEINPSRDELKVQDLSTGSSRSTSLFSHSSHLQELKQPQVIPSQPSLAKQERLYSHSSLKLLERKDVFYGGSLNRIPQYRDVGVDALTQLDMAEQVVQPSKMPKLLALKKTLIQIAGLSLLKNPVFLLIMMSSVLWTALSTVLTILPDYSVEQGISTSKAAFILSMIGVTNVVGRIGSGWISDQPAIDVLVVNMAALYVGGAMCLCVPFSTNYSLLLTEAGVFGLCMATWTSLRLVVLVELLGIDCLTNAFGLLAMFQGLAFLVGPPLAGLIYDVTGSYTGPFLTAGLAFILSGIFIVPLRKLNSVNRKNKQTANT